MPSAPAVRRWRGIRCLPRTSHVVKTTEPLLSVWFAAAATGAGITANGTLTTVALPTASPR